ncbi:putative double-strand-break repair protein rad21 protein [Venturia nashicola]|uniref:Putative double-strand-break repair protein rad21 protein n=1 Tax=Venturia nashicola TaxID=86259 RepID=A0A4Z1P9F8_9PEZI|nr:putative double-strand-break repair protein rad21 protein [Venturia nashicola]
MGSDDEDELRSLLTAFGAQKTPSKLTPAKVRQKTPRSAPSSTSAYARSQSLTVTPLPSPLAAYVRSSVRIDTLQLSDQTAATIGEPIQPSKEERAEAIVLALIQDRATGVNWDAPPHISNLGSIFHLDRDEAVEMLGIWYPCIAKSRLSRAVERYRYRLEDEEDEETEMEIAGVASEVGISFDSAIVLESEEEMVEADHKIGNSFDSAIVISDEEENDGKVQDAAAKESVETSEVLLPALHRTPSLGSASIDIEPPKTPNNAQDVIELPTPMMTPRPLVQHSREYSPPVTPENQPDYSLYSTGSPRGKKRRTSLEEDFEVEFRAPKIPRKGLYAPSVLQELVPGLPQLPMSKVNFTVSDKNHEHYPSPAKTPVKDRTSFIHVDRTSPSPQQRSVKMTPARVKRSRVLKVDARIEIPNVVLKAQRDDPSEILVPKGSTQLPKDRMVLALLSEHKNTHRFVANVFGAERRLLWASELRGILSVDTIQRCGRYNRGLEVGDEKCGLY